MSSLIPVEVREAKEPWSEYHLEDGATLRVKIVLLQISRHPDKFTPDGEPVYEVKIAPVINTKAPEALRRKGK